MRPIKVASRREEVAPFSGPLGPSTRPSGGRRKDAGLRGISHYPEGGAALPNCVIDVLAGGPVYW